MKWLRAVGAQKALRFVSYQQIWVTLPTGEKIRITSPFFVKANAKRGRKKRGPQNRGQHLLLSLMGFVNKVEQTLAFRAVQLAVLAPSFDTASKILQHQAIKLSPNKIRQMVTEIFPDTPGLRVEQILASKEDKPLKNQRVLICVDGGRLRQRKNKRGPRPNNSKRCGFHTQWIEPKLFAVYLIDEHGDIIKKVPAFVDGTTGKLPSFLQLFEHYLIRLGIQQAAQVILVADGAPWIWERVPKLLKQIGVDKDKIREIIDWTHAKQNLNKAFDLLSKSKRAKLDIKQFKNLLFSGKIGQIVDQVKSVFKVGAASKIVKKLKSYFVSNQARMQYAENRAMKLPIGSGVIESAIRRVINMRVKAPGSFWKLDFAEAVIYLRAQLLYGRWENLIENRNKALIIDFQTVSISTHSNAKKI
jgi:hypothetical protein